jgi:hypothetical protein
MYENRKHTLTFVAVKTKRTRGVFSELTETSDRKAAWDSFIYELTQETPTIYYTKHFKSLLSDLDKLSNDYQDLIKDKDFQKTLSKLTSIEEKMLQIHCFFDAPLTFGTLLQNRTLEPTLYVIVRAPFPVPEVKRKEIRVYLGKLSDYDGKTIKDLEMDNSFVEFARGKVRQAMLDIILAGK